MCASSETKVVHVICYRASTTFGHGDYGWSLVLADSYRPQPFPAFESDPAARYFISTLPSHQAAYLIVQPVEILT